jgi:hypothetical protein
MARRKSYDELKAELVTVYKWMEDNWRFNPKNRQARDYPPSTSSGDDTQANAPTTPYPPSTSSGDDTQANAPTTPYPPGISSGDDVMSSLRSRLKELEELRSDGSVSEDEYEYWRSQILATLAS